MRKNKELTPSEINVGDRVYIVTNSREIRRFPPEGVVRGQVVKIIDDFGNLKFLCRFPTDFGSTSGWYRFDQIGVSEEDWACKQ